MSGACTRPKRDLTRRGIVPGAPHPDEARKGIVPSGAEQEVSHAEAWCWTWLVVAMLWVVYNLLDFAGWGLLAVSVGCAAVSAVGIVAVRRRAARRSGPER